ncbi:MAG: hypothetical protein O3C28_20845 [Proteobacteria bacterium]|nr:hypothetical protein [Pseudomonadota bacterium]
MRIKYFLQRSLTRIASIRLTQWALIGLLASAIVVTGTLFHPKIQERLVLKYIAPSFVHFTVQRIHLLPWSLNATDLSFEIHGAKVSAQALSIRFCLSSLLSKTLDFKSISLVDAIIDLRSFIPSDSEPKEPFAGAFPLLDQGFGLNLGGVDINAFALLNSTDHIRLEIAGGRIAPHEVGALSFVSTMKINDGDSVKLEGLLEIDQLSKGHFNAISLTADSTIDAKSLPHPELVHLQAVVKPTAQPPRRKVEIADGEVQFEPQPESVEMSVRFGTENQAGVQLKALYDGRLGDLKGDYQFDTDDKFLASYLENVALPAFDHSAGGTLAVNLVDLRGQLSLISRTDFTNVRRLLLDNPKAPMRLSLVQKVGLSFTDEQVRIEKIHIEIEDDSTTEMLTTGLLEPIVISLAEPSAVLNEAATFLTLTIGAVQLEWLDSFVADYGVMSGVVSGSFAVKSDGEGRLIVEPSEATVIDNIRVDSGDMPLFEDLKIELKPLLQASTDNASIALNDIVVSLAEQPIATLKLRASVPTGEKNDSDIRFTLAGSVQVDPIIADPRIQTQLVDFEIPTALTFDFDTKLTQRKKSWLIRSLNASLTQAGKDKLIDVHTTQKINIALASGDQDFV